MPKVKEGLIKNKQAIPSKKMFNAEFSIKVASILRCKEERYALVNKMQAAKGENKIKNKVMYSRG